MMNNRGVASIAFILVGIVLLLVVISVISRVRGRPSPVSEITQKATEVITGGAGFNFGEGTPGYENLKKLMQGCPFKDCIPSIDDPKFESVGAANEWLNDDDVVFALEHKGLPAQAGEARAYPQRILNWHEIVNDYVKLSSDNNVASEDFYFVVTFCPLCGSALAFERVVDGQVLEFGVSGKLHNNDLVMYDRQTESLWQQITGEALVGEYFGKRLKQIPLSGMRWREFKEEFSKAKVLSRDTGFSRNYSVYPYGNYEEDSAPLFPVSGGVDETIHPKTVVYGVEIDKSFKAYEEEKIKDEGQIEDTVGGVKIKISYNNGVIMLKRLDTNEEIPATRLFWFAWKAFRPETELY